MYISRIEVEGGFLSGLDLRFAPGFNAVIGARGTGKTSLVELIRFCLAAPVLSERVSSQVARHASAILGDGTAIVTVSDGTKERRYSKSADSGAPPRPALVVPLVLAQNEIESIGLEPQSRLRLLDGFASEVPTSDSTAELASLESEIASLRNEIRQYDERLASLAPVVQELLEARKALAVHTAQSTRIETLNKALKSVNSDIQPVIRETEYLKEFKGAFVTWAKDFASAASRMPKIMVSKDLPNSDRLAQWREQLASVQGEISVQTDNLRQLLNELTGILESAENELQALESKARPLRTEIDGLNKAAGETARKVATLERRVSEGEAVAKIREQRIKEIETLRAQRESAMNHLEAARADRSLFRKKTANALNAKLKPRIRIGVNEAGNTSEYSKRIVQALRGTGLHAADLASRIAQRISPRDLVKLIDSENRKDLARLLQVTPDRATKVITGLAPATPALLSADVEDDVTLMLLDGSEYKPTDALSTGQRCTVVLPILLETERGTLIIDQPEDHLDNAFIVDTLVKGIRQRASLLQLIWTTHNANLPVLGEADRVIQMDSNGIRGYVKVAGALDDHEVVSAITNVMEGGAEAFRRRSEFYRAHSK